MLTRDSSRSRRGYVNNGGWGLMLIVAAVCILFGIGLVYWEMVSDYYMGRAEPPAAVGAP